jgi:hypothetical protein
MFEIVVALLKIRGKFTEHEVVFVVFEGLLFLGALFGDGTNSYY